jgi:hypothetical protein
MLPESQTRCRLEPRANHMTLSLVALWFLCLERRVGGENPRGHGAADEAGLHAAAPSPGADPGGDRRSRHAVLRRNEEARIYHWYKATGEFPPRRSQPDTS